MRKLRLLKYRLYNYGNKNKFLFIFFVSVCCVLIFTLLLDARVRPFIYSLAENKAKLLSVEIIENSVRSVLQDENITYNDLVTLGKNSQENVTSIETNMVKTNILKSEICSFAVSEIEKVSDYQLEIPLGALLGSDLLSGRGPHITIPITLTGRVEGEFQNDFSAAGINQTLHQVWINMNAEVYILLPGGATKTQVSSRVEIAQTVVVGLVPNAYVNADKFFTQK